MKEIATKMPEPDFQFVVNGVPVRAFGLNHVPCDALHSRDSERVHDILQLAAGADINILRIWGGSVPESDDFYCFCDREGIMIWHDFMFGCAIYPADRAFLEEAEREAIEIVRARRHHACIVLWAGDNECDTAPSYTFSHYADPNTFKLSREVLPNVCRLYAPSTPYLPSSPYVSPECFKLGTEMGLDDPALIAPEQHIWGSHEYFKSRFYQTDASFVSETGYFGSPCVSSLKKFLSPDCLWPWDNEEWYHHASNPFKPDCSYDYRIRRLPELIQEYFGFLPDNVEDFALASQICQAEANKYFVERGRLSPKMSGMTIWNLIDGWPHFSDAIVDYYFGKKISYWYCRRDFASFLIAADEAADWHRKICYCNDSNEWRSGRYVIREFGKGVIAEGNFSAAPRSRGVLENFETPALNQGLLLIEWTFEDGSRGANHAIMGLPRYDYKTYRDLWLPAIAELDNSFDPLTIAK
jgi:beta-mannosidase